MCWPNVATPLIVAITLTVGRVILFESVLSFLGFGIVAPTPSWGNMLNNAQDLVTTDPALAIYPGLLIFVTVIAVNFLGDGLQHALRPPQRILTHPPKPGAPAMTDTSRHVLVVGASRGLGLGLVAEFLKHGWTVTATHRGGRAPGLDALASPKLQTDTVDMNDDAAVAALHGRLAGTKFDLVFINAGISNDRKPRCTRPHASGDGDLPDQRHQLRSARRDVPGPSRTRRQPSPS